MNRLYNRLTGFILLTLLVIITAGCDTLTEEDHSGSSLFTPTATIDPTVYSVEGAVSSGVIAHIPSPEQLSLSISSSDGRYTTTWPTLASYPMREPYRPGRYIVDAFSGSESEEGFDSPYFFGRAIVDMVSGQTSSADIVCRLANSVFDINFSEAFTNYFTDPKATIHSSGGAYITFDTDESRNAYLRPGKVTIILNLTMPSGGEKVEFVAATVNETAAQNLYRIDIDAVNLATGTPRIVLSFDNRMSDDDITFDLTPEFIASAPPAIESFGFTEGTPLELTEGDIPAENVGFAISGATARSLVLTTQSEDLIALGWPAECDLTNIDSHTLATMESLGLVLTRSGGTITKIDLTKALGKARTTSRNPSFALTATSAMGKLAGPMVMNVILQPADINVISTSNAIMGLNVAHMKIFSRANDLAQHLMIETLSEANSTWEKAELLSIESDESNSGMWDVTFKIPEASVANVDIRVIYCNEEKYRGTVAFSSPKFSIDVDAFARIAIVQIEAEDPQLIDVITSMVNIYVNGEQTVLLSRFTDMGKIVVGGLNASTRYEFKATLFGQQQSNGQFSNSVSVMTENILEVPNGGFEDVKDGIRYKNMPSGGRYSQNIVDIYNQQNHTSFDQYVPKRWANVNAKTFCRSASNHNTWYMQPSTYSIMDCMEGAYAVCLQTTAWDLNGPAIADYRQTAQPYTAYSQNIPTIANRAAGKIFLGEYGFDPTKGTEAYIEGVSFTSRPSALNGYYKLTPSLANLAENGLIRIEIIGIMGGSEIVIASGTKKLAVATDYTTFTIPLTYSDFKIKATKLKILISSSESIGTIETETDQIRTYSDPVTSTSLGATLWVDDLTFAY